MKLLDWETRIMETSIFITFIYLLISKTSTINAGVASIIIILVTVILKNKYKQARINKQEENNHEEKQE